MKAFLHRLAAHRPAAGKRRWVFVPYDQLTDRVGPLSRIAPRELGIVVVESGHKAARRPYHKHKLAFVLANLRHFCLEQAARGVAVRHVATDADYETALRDVARELGPMLCMRPAERELREELSTLVRDGVIELVDHEGWITTRAQFDASHEDGAPYRMDRFYRHVRKATGVLMDGGKFAGGKLSFDAENRKRWNGDPAAPSVPTFVRDEVTDEVVQLVQRKFADHPGTIDLEHLPATKAHADAMWQWAKRECLPHFGPYQDAMSTQSESLFHSRLSPLLNVLRVLPKDVVDDACAMELPIASKEGFVRQVLGWREYVRHVHDATDGFRSVTKGRDARGAAAPSFLGAKRALPPAWWGQATGMRCLDSCVSQVWQTGYGHHISRLMVLANLATLLDVSPRELTDWFWCAYADAYDWVVEPNVLGMGTFAVGDLMTTKPYVAGAAYIDGMSDFCKSCAFDPKKDCPVRSLYWAWMARHEERLRDNPRMSIPLQALKKRAAELRSEDANVFARVTEALARGAALGDESEGKRGRGGAKTRRK